MHLRLYQPEDWLRLCEIHDAARLHELRAARLEAAFLSLAQTADSEGLFAGELVVAETDGRPDGFVAYADGELTWLYVDPLVSRRGIGRRLLRHAIEACSGRLSTEVLVGNEAALALYLSEGFRIIERRDGHLTGNEQFAASANILEYVHSEN